MEKVFLLKDCFLFPAQELVSLVVEGSKVTLVPELNYAPPVLFSLLALFLGSGHIPFTDFTDSDSRDKACLALVQG